MRVTRGRMATLPLSTRQAASAAQDPISSSINPASDAAWQGCREGSTRRTHTCPAPGPH